MVSRRLQSLAWVPGEVGDVILLKEGRRKS